MAIIFLLIYSFDSFYSKIVRRTSDAMMLNGEVDIIEDKVDRITTQLNNGSYLELYSRFFMTHKLLIVLPPQNILEEDMSVSQRSLAS